MKNIEKYRNLIAKGEVDALLLTSKHNRMYAAEYCVAEGVSVICKEESYYFTDFRYIEAAQKNLPGFTVVMTDADHPYTKLINDAIAAHTVKTLGFEDDSLTVEEYTLYNTKLNAVLHPYSAEINAPRQSKEPWEIEYMKKAQEITDRTFEDLLNVIRPGMTEKELCAELIYRLYKFGSEGPSFDPITISGPNTSLPHGVPSERELQYGDFVTMDFGCLYHGYCSDMTRTIALGYVSEKMDKVYHTVLEAQLAGIAATKAGVTGKAMDAAARKVIDDAGFVGCFGHSYGHSLGLLIHEAPNASMRNDKPMPAGAVVSAEPGIYIPDEFGVRIEDVTVITDNMPAFVMEREHVDLFTCAADAICLDGYVVNKVGTLQIAICANHFGIPTFVTGAPDIGHETKDTVRIEMRDPDFTLQAMGVRTAAAGVKGYYPAFDMTPPHLISGIVTDRGVFSPFDLHRYFQSGGSGEYDTVV